MRNLNFYNIKKWYKMMTGKSILHVNQGLGRHFQTDTVAGYYNDLREKVSKGEDHDQVVVPKITLPDGEKVYFPIAVFQYGLGAYDLFIETGHDLYMEKFRAMVEWALDNQESDGSWSNFYYIYPKHPFSSMAQGEGASLLVRAYVCFGDCKYIEAARKALSFMLKPLDEGGTAKYEGDELYLMEYTHKPVVLNGWIFSIFGLYDYLLAVEDHVIKEAYDKTLSTLSTRLEDFDNGYWSTYDSTEMLTSPFYHHLHISQMEAIYALTGEQVYEQRGNLWKEYAGRRWNRGKAFVLKAYQKLTER